MRSAAKEENNKYGPILQHNVTVFKHFKYYNTIYFNQ